MFEKLLSEGELEKQPCIDKEEKGNDKEECDHLSV